MHQSGAQNEVMDTAKNMFGDLFELLIVICCLRDADLKPLLHSVTAFPVSAGERGVCPKACCCISSLHLTEVCRGRV